MRRLWTAFAVLIATLAMSPTVQAGISVEVDIRSQRMTVSEDGAVVAVWPVSTARRGKVTPTGQWRPVSMRRIHYSSLYDNAPMPYAIFFSGNYAIHGTTAVRQLGRPASAGCVRLSPAHARELFAMVQRRGMAATRIAIRHGGGDATMARATPRRFVPVQRAATRAPLRATALAAIEPAPVMVLRGAIE